MPAPLKFWPELNIIQGCDFLNQSKIYIYIGGEKEEKSKKGKKKKRAQIFLPLFLSVFWSKTEFMSKTDDLKTVIRGM